MNHHKNSLENETSPYLLQHKTNPVWWQPWGPAAFESAVSQNKPIFLSIGYSTCHWCHVMEKDSFEKADAAAAINKYFVAIKVDREERPDVDSLYMNAVQSLTGHGGWPMTVLLTPDGKAFWGGTFVAHDQLIHLVTQAGEMWKTHPNDLQESADKITAYLAERTELPQGSAELGSVEPLRQFFHSFEGRFDSQHGGYQGSPKFPPALSLMTLLRIHRETADERPLKMVTQTLQQIRRGGIYDQLGGGFHRYSVDDHWLVPHFEKMLYDNALLTTAYLEAYQVTKDPEFAMTATETLDYVLRDMTSAQGGFYSAEDADSEDIEGKFYVWSLDEVRQHLSEKEFSIFRDTFNLTERGNFHAHRTGDEVTDKRLGPPALTGNILHLKPEVDLKILEKDEIKSALRKLLLLRGKRIRPHLDDKILVSWNSLMISALALGARVLGEPRYLKAAVKGLEFILAQESFQKTPPSTLSRTYGQGAWRHRAMAEDYAFLIAALLDVYAADFNPLWVQKAQALHQNLASLFWDSAKGGLFDCDGRDPHLIFRSKNFEDNVVPSANSVAACNGLRFYHLTGEDIYLKQAIQIFDNASVLVQSHPSAVPKLLQALDYRSETSFEVAIVGPNTPSFFKKTNAEFLPHVVWAFAEKENDLPLLKNRAAVNGALTFYICKNQTCELPETDEKKVLSRINSKASFSLLKGG